jgi:hypothetical protein
VPCIIRDGRKTLNVKVFVGKKSLFVGIIEAEMDVAINGWIAMNVKRDTGIQSQSGVHIEEISASHGDLDWLV